MKRPLFALGRTVATPGALEILEQLHVTASTLLDRHVVGDWGDGDADDKAANDHALREGERLFSSYTFPGGEKIWVITEWDRSVTTLLLPEDY